MDLAFDLVEKSFSGVAPRTDFWSLRLVSERDEVVSVRRGVVQPPRFSEEIGAMVTVHHRGGIGYSATADLTASGLRRAGAEATEWAERTAGPGLVAPTILARPSATGQYETLARLPWESVSLPEKIDLLRAQAARLRVDDRILDWEAGLWHTDARTLLLTSAGGRMLQRFRYLLPTMSVTANDGTETQTRTFGGHAWARQGGLEVLDDVRFAEAAERIAEDVLQLLAAANCPAGRTDLLLGPDQVILQLHESIGHPLELDRILGDERNYAGTSFVRPEMFGTYRYGSDLLNVVFDPTAAGELAGYTFDDEGQRAEKAHLIKDGVLLRALGGATSQARSGVPGVAAARSASWNRPPIDRMANLNLEPGGSAFEEMIARVERGVYMETNASWSIDDSRNKFQFGCEWARRIEDGRLTAVLKNPNYRGCAATFWRSLAAVGDARTVAVMGTPHCGKGEPNQLARVGHAAPACLFTDVEVFGGG